MHFLFPCIQGQPQTHNYKTIMIFTGPIRLAVGHNYWTKFHIPQNVTSSYLKGYVRASGSIVNNSSTTSRPEMKSILISGFIALNLK